MSTESSLTLDPGTVLDDRFVIRRALGSGGMAMVVEAEHIRLRQRVAIKLLRPEYASNPDLMIRFVREARAGACLRSEHVVAVMDVNSLPIGIPYMVMEYLDGADLGARLAQHGPLGVEALVEYMLQVLAALGEAHRHGIVHRDLKPSNLFLTRREDGSPLIKVLDFGISKLTGPEFTLKNLTANVGFLGSPFYVSPEQIRDPSAVDGRTDIWALGVVMYELLSGRAPFGSRKVPALISAICSGEPTPLSSLRPGLPQELLEIVKRCLKKQREDRYASVQELAQAFAPLVRQVSTQASLDRVLGTRSRSDDSRFPSGPPPAWGSVTPAPQVASAPSQRPSGSVAAALMIAAVACATGLVGLAAWGPLRGARELAHATGSALGAAAQRPLVASEAHAPARPQQPSAGAHFSLETAPPSASALPPSLVAERAAHCSSSPATVQAEAPSRGLPVAAPSAAVEPARKALTAPMNSAPRPSAVEALDTSTAAQPNAVEVARARRPLDADNPFAK